jgi:hypothetical protein
VGLYHEVQDATLAMQQSHARLEAVLKATGGASGQTAESVSKLADQLSRLTQFDDTALKNASTTLLTFTEITGDTFSRILKLSADLAATGRGDLDTWVTVLARRAPSQRPRSAWWSATGQAAPRVEGGDSGRRRLQRQAARHALLLDEVARRVPVARRWRAIAASSASSTARRRRGRA